MVPLDAHVLLYRMFCRPCFELRPIDPFFLDHPRINCHSLSIFEFGTFCFGPAGLGVRAI